MEQPITFQELSAEMIAMADWAERSGYFAFPILIMKAHARLLEYRIKIDRLESELSALKNLK